jgi:DNA polymerase V
LLRAVFCPSITILESCSFRAAHLLPTIYLEKCLDINEYLIRNPAATFLVRVSGDSMKDAGILDGDMLVVDRSLQAMDGKIVIALIHGEFTVKTLKMRNGKAFLVPANAAYPVIEVTPEMECEVWGCCGERDQGVGVTSTA